MIKKIPYRPVSVRQPLPRSFKDLTPAKHFNPRTFFREMVWKALLTRRTGQHRQPVFPKLRQGQVAVTWIGHASFLVQFTDLNVLIDPTFANWLFLLKRIKGVGRYCTPEIALLPIRAYHPESFRHVHMGPDEAIKVFKDLKSRWLVPMHYGTFRLSFEDMDEPPRWLLQLAMEQGLTPRV